MARKIAFVSGKGGVGKTTLAGNLALALARRGERVALCDLHFSLNGLDALLGVEEPTYDVVDAVAGRCRARQALVRLPREPNVCLLTSGRVESDRFVSTQALKLVVADLEKSFDYILFDGESGVGEGFHRLVSLADEAFVVTGVTVAELRATGKVLSLLKEYALSSVQLCLNGLRFEECKRGFTPSPNEVETLLKTPVVAVVPYLETFRYQGVYLHRSITLFAKNVRFHEQKKFPVGSPSERAKFALISTVWGWQV